MSQPQATQAEDKAIQDASRQFGVSSEKAKKALGPALQKMAKAASEILGRPIEANMAVLLALPPHVLEEVQRRMVAELQRVKQGGGKKSAPRAFEMAKPKNKFI